MHIPFNYQATEYDCVPVTFINALIYLFDRKSIPPEVIQKIMQYSLDTINKNGEVGKRGTTGLSCQLILQWLETYKKPNEVFSVCCDYLVDADVNLKSNNKIARSLNNGGVALCSVLFDNTASIYHYMLALKADTQFIYFFDPYYRTRQFQGNDKAFLEIIKDNPDYNLKVSRERLDSIEYEKYSFGPVVNRSCCLISRL